MYKKGLLFIVFLSGIILSYLWGVTSVVFLKQPACEVSYFTHILGPFCRDPKTEALSIKTWSQALLSDNKTDKGSCAIPFHTPVLSEVYNLISTQYYGYRDISQKDFEYGMISWLVKSLWDKFSEFMTLDEAENFNEVLRGDFEWIGAVIQKGEIGVVVERVIAGSPAKDGNLLPNDIIVKANGTELKDLTLPDAVSKIRWPAWTVVDLEIIRAGEKDILSKRLTRRKIDIPSIVSKSFDEYEYVGLTIFGEKTAIDFRQALSSALAKNPKGLILDLRDNGGGFLEIAVDVLSNFIEKDRLVVETRARDPRDNESFFSHGIQQFMLPLVVLVNGNSASASEIVAGALKDYKLAILVGEKTYGKGSVQKPYTLGDQSELKITIAKWFTPGWYGIDKVGIMPDIVVVPIKSDFEKQYDRQLEVAKKILKSMQAGLQRAEIIQQFSSGGLMGSGSKTKNR